MTDQETEVLAAFRACHRELERAMRTGSYSLGLLAELAQHRLSGTADVHAIVDEIRHLENDPAGSRAKEARRFKDEPLKGLWYKHYFQTRFLAQNLLNELPRVDVAALLRRHAQPGEGGDVAIDGHFLDDLAREAVHVSFERRAEERRLTGEWIVFDRTGAGNHYLTLARHREGENRKEGDRRVFARVEECRRQDAALKGARISDFRVAPPRPASGDEAP